MLQGGLKPNFEPSGQLRIELKNFLNLSCETLWSKRTVHKIWLDGKDFQNLVKNCVQ